MIRVVILEDETQCAQRLSQFLIRYGQERNEEFSITYFEDGLNFISDYNPNTDLVFMDIILPHMNGMDCAVRLRKLDQNVLLVFVTSMMQYAVKGYEVDAIGYMLKPISYFPFSVLMDKVMTRISLTPAKEIYVQNRDYIKRISSKDLFYVEVLDHYLVYHTQEGNFSEIGKLKDIELQLNGYDFYRCSNSHLVNLRFVKEIDKEEVVVGNDRIFISRRRKKDFLIAMNDYLKKG